MKKNGFDELFELMKLNRQKCPWAKDRNMRKHVDELVSEVNELKEAVEKNDSKEIKGELGDVLCDAFFLGIIAEEKGHFKLHEAIDTAIAKFRRRKPWLFGKKPVESREEAIRIWNKAKEREKEQK